MHVMIDLETMGRDPDAPIVAIGACRFSATDEPHEWATIEAWSMPSSSRRPKTSRPCIVGE